MPFDKPTRNALARMVGQARELLKADLTRQLQTDFRLQPDGTALPLDGLTDEGRAAAEELRQLLDHYAAGLPGEDRRAAFDRLVREIGFTVLNRLAALRMCEERGLVVECVRQGLTSEGFQLFERLTGGALGSRYAAYRVFLENLFDELSLDLGVLFDRRSPLSRVFPSERALEDVLGLLNQAALRDLWREDETIGWVYQYYNDNAERDKMRESQAPRNSRELAVRNQFFTPRYVVEFLTDNTLGRLWYEMRLGRTRLAEECRYLVRRPDEPPADRAKKDPRDLKLLDPACGSGHFLLYAFDLLAVIYEEAWADPESPSFSGGGRSLAADYPDLGALRRALPGLILRHNLHGIDIDPRATQIAALALWLRAQRHFQALGLRPAERPRIERVNVVCAEPMPGDRALLDEFVADLRPKVLGDLVRVVFEKMKLAGEAGSLLKIEEELRDAVAAAREQWARAERAEQMALLPEARRAPQAEQLALFDVSDITDERFWDEAEARVLEALQDYAEQAANGATTRRRLFADDVAHGFAFIDLYRKKYDAVLMNPPFGFPSTQSKGYINSNYTDCKEDIDAAFVRRGASYLIDEGRLGAIINRTQFFKPTLGKWRNELLLGESTIELLADFGYGVLDAALVEAAAYVLSKSHPVDSNALFLRLLKTAEKADDLLRIIHGRNRGDAVEESFFVAPLAFKSVPESRIAYWSGEAIRAVFRNLPAFEGNLGTAKQGLSTSDDFRFIRAFWEVFPDELIVSRDSSADGNWRPVAKGGEYSPYFQDFHLVVKWKSNGAELKAIKGAAIRNPSFYLKPGITYSERTASGFSPRVLPRGCIITQIGPGMYPAAETMILPFVGLLMTRTVANFIEMMVEAGDAVQSGSAARHYTQNVVGGIPIPAIPDKECDKLSELTRILWEAKRTQDSWNEESRYFYAPPFLRYDDKNAPQNLRSCIALLLQVKENADLVILEHSQRVERISRDLYQLDKQSQQEVDDEFGLHPWLLNEQAQLDNDILRRLYLSSIDDIIDERVAESGGSRTATKKTYYADRKLEAISAFLAVHPRKVVSTRSNLSLITDADLLDSVHRLLSYLLGVVVGRWDIRIAADPSLVPAPTDPFAHIPICAPGMLVGPNGLPAITGHIVSPAWLRARPDAITLPPEGAVAQPTIPDSAYPLRIAWDGVLVDDPGLGGEPEHDADIVRRVREALRVIWAERAEAIEAEACELLEVRDLREYFRKPAGFFADHLKRYSKSRRQAPIYWPLSTASGRYTVWVYYHRLTADTLHTVVNRYVTPKWEAVTRRVEVLSEKLAGASGRAAAQLRDELDDLKGFASELADLRAELLRVAALPYKPDLNDGVILNAAPLHRLFRLKKWAADCKAAWESLAAGEYEWAHLAYTIWPDRVRKVCETDRSIAIAHGLEELYKGEAEKPKRERKPKAKKAPAADGKPGKKRGRKKAGAETPSLGFE